MTQSLKAKNGNKNATDCSILRVSQEAVNEEFGKVMKNDFLGILKLRKVITGQEWVDN
jgi:hypothetical protein